ncbi:hypothetical protein Leryth_015186 [Lithospermum erythrorhizon]|nr:hypothetical protein Leryth_015186 [Lithospermum erythrorhizon]
MGLGYDTIINMRNHRQASAMPSVSALQNGHLPSRGIPVSRGISETNGYRQNFDSDMDTGSDSDTEVYGSRYSVETSPQDDKASISASSGYNFHGFSMAGMQKNKYSENIPSAPPLNVLDHVSQVSRSETVRVSGATSYSEINGDSASVNISNAYKATPVVANLSSTPDPSVRTASVSSYPVSACFPTYHASELGSWYGVISYEACVRLCLHAWARGCKEAPFFLENECAVLRNSFSLKHVLLQSEEELMTRRSSELISEAAAIRTKKTLGKMKVQVRKVKIGLDSPTGCSFSSIKPSQVKVDALRTKISNTKSTMCAEWANVRKTRVRPHIPSNGSISQKSLAYMHVGAQYMKELSGVVKVGLTSMRSNSSTSEAEHETHYCLLRLKSMPEEDAVRMLPGSGENYVFLPDGLGDDLVIEVHDSKGTYHGRVVAQMADIADDPGDKLRWWSIYREPDHELIGRIQLYINYGRSHDETSNIKCGSVAETVAYDFILETAMKDQRFQQRKLQLHGPWKWLITEFSKYYGVSDAYTNLRYLSYIMDVATPTADCLDLVYDLLLPVARRSRPKETLSHQENRILGEVSEQIEQIISVVFENYKSLDESSPSGVTDVLKPASGSAAPALASALKLYNLLNDILSPEAQLKLCKYFQIAARKRCKRYLAETEDYVSNNNESLSIDPQALSTAYQKMRILCLNLKNEIFTDIQIHNMHILPSFLDLSNISSSIYSTELSTRIRNFLLSYPPTSPSLHVMEIAIETADYQRDLLTWNINPVKGGVDAKELFHSYISRWIKGKRVFLLDSCKLDKVKSNQRQQPATPFVEDIYNKLKESLDEYEVIINRWPEYAFPLECAVADVEKAVVDTLENLYADVLYPLKENSMPVKLGLKYVHKFAKGGASSYTVPNELGIALNSMKRMLNVLRPPIEAELKSWSSCIAGNGIDVPGEHLSEITVMLRAKLRTYSQGVTEKLVENTKLQNTTKLKKILQDAKEGDVDSDMRNRMQPLKELLEKMINQLHVVFDEQLFVTVCRSFWDRMGQDLLKLLQERKENMSLYKASRLAISVSFFFQNLSLVQRRIYLSAFQILTTNLIII